MKQKIVRQLQTVMAFWGVCIAVLFLPYLGLYIIGFKPIDVVKFFYGTAVLGFVFALLLTLDQQIVTPREHTEQLTLWGLFHELIVRRKSLLTLFILAGVGMALATYYIAVSLFSVEYTGDSGVMIRLPGHTVYYIPISPYGESSEIGGWENTGIPLEKDEAFTLEISGTVSPGFLQGLDLLQRHMRQLIEWEMRGRSGSQPQPPQYPTWSFTGPEGYHPDWYPGGREHKGHEQLMRDYMTDEGLTVKGKPHNSVIGIILPPGQQPKKAKGGELPRAGYDWEKEQSDLLYLSAKTYPCSMTSNRRGVLWVTINDADDFRWDNVGFYFLKLTRRPGPFRGFQGQDSGMLNAACRQP